VDEIVPEACAWELSALRPNYDLYVLKSKNPLDLDLAEGLEGAGARVINTAQSSRLVKDKIVHTTLLARAGVPQPQAWAVASLAALEALLEEQAAECLVKPPAGSMQKGIYTLKQLDDLSEREHEVFRLIARGLSNAEIGKELYISETTVKTHVTHILQKLDLRDRVQAVVLAYQSGLMDQDGSAGPDQRDP
jgi:DNA-binding NarL/FixJ family response regulator